MRQFFKENASLFFMGGIILFFVGLVGLMIYATWHDSVSRRAHEEHDAFVLRQEICIVHDGWYCPEEENHGLMACRRLSDHSLFYVIQETGQEVFPTEDR